MSLRLIYNTGIFSLVLNLHLRRGFHDADTWVIEELNTKRKRIRRWPDPFSNAIDRRGQKMRVGHKTDQHDRFHDLSVFQYY